MAHAAAVLVTTGELSRGFRLARRGAAGVRGDRRLRGGAASLRPPPLRGARLPLRLPRPQGRRPRRPRGPRHRPLRRPPPDRHRPVLRDDAGVPRAAVRGRGQAVRAGGAARPAAEVHRREPAAARPPRRHDVGAGEDARQEGDARHGRGAAQALRRAQGDPGPRVLARHALAGGVRGIVPVRPDRGPARRDHRHQGRHGVVHADGPAAVRRRRLRQDRGGDARRLQGGDGRQAGGVPRADHGPRVPAPEDAARAVRGIPGPHRHGQPLPHEGRDQADAGRPGRRQGGGDRRHAPPAVEGRRSSRTSACSSWTRSSGSAWRTRSASSRCAARWTSSR